MEVSNGEASTWNALRLGINEDLLCRPKEHHAFDILHWVKVAFKKHALDNFQESDCFNKEAFRYVNWLPLQPTSTNTEIYPLHRL
jgi:hypothetical protein